LSQCTRPGSNHSVNGGDTAPPEAMSKHRKAGILPHRPATVAQPSSPLRRILLVEDDPDLRVIASFALRRGGFDFEVCGDGREALDKAPLFRPDLILLDVMLPFLDGPGILRELRRDPAFAATEVIFMTARALPEEIAEYRTLGCIDVIVKPFDPMTLAETIQSLWDRHYRQAAAGERSELAELEKKYVRQLPSRLAEIEQVAGTLGEKGGRDDLDRLFHLSHRLTGSSATLGFPRISDAARAVENLLIGWRTRRSRLTVAERRLLGSRLRDLRREASEVVERAPYTRE